MHKGPGMCCGTGLRVGCGGELGRLDACGLEEVAHLVAGSFAVVGAKSCFPA